MKKPTKPTLKPIAALFRQEDIPTVDVFHPDALMKEMIELVKALGVDLINIFSQIRVDGLLTSTSLLFRPDPVECCPASI